MGLISYVVPVYHNAGSITQTANTIRALFDAGSMGDHTYEVIFVDDGSKDASYDEMRAVAAQDPNVRLLKFTRNFGQVPAITAGYAEARGDAVINISADLQDPVELTVDMVEAWQGGSEIAVAYREDREDSLGARTFSRLAYGALRMSNPAIPKGGFDFVLMSRRAVDAYLSYRGRNRFYQGDILWAGYRTAFLPYRRRKRKVGRSQYTFGKKLKLFFDFLLDGSYLPIRIMSMVGAGTAVMGLLYSVVVVSAWLLGETPFSGWAPLMIAILLVGGIIMMMLGIIGEYLWRILDEVKQKPLYVVDDFQTRASHVTPPPSDT